MARNNSPPFQLYIPYYCNWLLQYSIYDNMTPHTLGTQDCCRCSIMHPPYGSDQFSFLKQQESYMLQVFVPVFLEVTIAMKSTRPPTFRYSPVYILHVKRPPFLHILCHSFPNNWTKWPPAGWHLVIVENISCPFSIVSVKLVFCRPRAVRSSLEATLKVMHVI